MEICGETFLAVSGGGLVVRVDNQCSREADATKDVSQFDMLF
jgi:hypothetical protein